MFFGESLELKSAEIIESWHRVIEARKSNGMGSNSCVTTEDIRRAGTTIIFGRFAWRKRRNDFPLLPAPTPEVREGKVTRERIIAKYGEHSTEIPNGFSRQTILAIMEGLKYLKIMFVLLECPFPWDIRISGKGLTALPSWFSSITREASKRTIYLSFADWEITESKITLGGKWHSTLLQTTGKRDFPMAEETVKSDRD